jgi:hypothetical protein
MWMVQRYYHRDCQNGPIEPFFVTTDWELAHTSVAVMNHNLHQAKALAKQYPRHPRDGSAEELEEYVKLREAHDAQIEALVLEYDTQEGSTDISYYEIVEIEVR